MPGVKKQYLHNTGFTLVEVIVALVIVSISLLGLIRLHLISISMADAAEMTSQAVLLAEEKIAETLALGYPKEGTASGVVEKNIIIYFIMVNILTKQRLQRQES